MKILYLHQYFNTPSMPGGARSYEMARRLVQWGHEVHMITTDREGQEPRGNSWRETEEAGIHVHWTPIPYSNKMSYGERIRAFFAFSWRASRKAAEIGGDVVFATSTPLTIALPGVYASKKLKIPMVFEVRDLWPEVPIALGVLKNPLTKAGARWLERFAYNNSAHIVALAPGMKEHIVKTGYPEEKITVIPNGADVELFNIPKETGELLRNRYPWLGDRPLVVSAGTLGMVNGTERLVDLAAELQERTPDIRFAIIGSGKAEETIRRYAREKGVLDTTLFMLGQIPKTEVPAWLSAATVCAIFYDGPEIVWRDSVPNKFFDCLAAGKPFISNIRGWSQIEAERHGAGIILDMNTPSEASEALSSFLNNEEKLSAASQAANRLAHGKFNRVSLAGQLEQTLVRVREEHP